MLKICKDQWNKNREKLFEVFKTKPGLNECGYLDIVKILFDTLFNHDEDDEVNKLNINNITEIDNGDYQGTLLYVIPFTNYQPSAYEHLITFIDYGSCSACDTLLGIQTNWRSSKRFRDVMQRHYFKYN